jgi:PAS domain S-box-containing protein
MAEGAVTAPQTESDCGPPVARGRILVADDSPIVRAIVVGALRAAGYLVDEAEDGASALQLLDRGAYDVLLTDLRMPAVDGFGVLEFVRLRELSPEVVVLTGTHAQDINAAIRAMRLGANDFLMKPLTGPDQAVLSVDRAIEKKRQREALREAQARYQQLFERVPIGLYRTTSDGGFLEANPALLQMLGCPDRETLLSARAGDFYVCPEDRRRWQEVIERDGVVSRFELQLHRWDGSVLWVEDTARLVRDAAGRVVCYEGSLQDITERKRADEALRRSEAGFRLLFENNPHPMAVYDQETMQMLEVNEASVHHYGYSRDEFLARRVTDFCPPEDAPAMREELARRAAGTVTDGKVWRNRLKDGRLIDVEVASHGLEFAGRPGVLVVAHDITDRRRLEAQLRQAQKMEAVGRLAGGVAHDFNNVLTAISGYAELLLREIAADDSRHTKVLGILRGADQAAALTRQLLAFSRRQMVRPRVLDLNEVIDEMEDLLRRLIGEDVELVTRLDPGLGRIKADRGQIEQLLMNLAANARDAMPMGGRLAVETANLELDDAFVQGHVGAVTGRHVQLTVRDTGHGMDKETQSHIFEPFFTTKELGKGTGLGLATVYGIVKQAGGYIWVESDIGRGTSFTIYFPITDQPAEGGDRPVSVVGAEGGDETVLVVEDDEMVRALVGQALQAAGYRVLSAGDGDEALQLAHQHPSAIELMVTDVVMPGMNGPQLVERLHASRPETAILFISGYADSTVVRQQVLLAGSQFLQKPFTVESLLARVRILLDSAPA